MVRKIMRSLSKAWRCKVTAIQEAKDLNVLSLDAFIWSLKTHKIELNETSEQTNRRGKSITLKSTKRRSSSSKATKVVEESDKNEEDPSNDDEKDKIAYLVEKISKACIRRKKKGVIPKKDKK